MWSYFLCSVSLVLNEELTGCRIGIGEAGDRSRTWFDPGDQNCLFTHKQFLHEGKHVCKQITKLSFQHRVVATKGESSIIM
jgi:hypothetical protein